MAFVLCTSLAVLGEGSTATQQTTATTTNGDDTANDFSSRTRQRRGPRPSFSLHHFPPCFIANPEASGMSSGTCTKVLVSRPAISGITRTDLDKGGKLRRPSLA
ncbi:hypothetical protein B0T18DRAFT_83662 [Schizothecium vesticola]|uniref:Secreted protein n=1 Tax=Schizothecium vesticola TaxID=314040 RepID=A0AA40KAP0_9PEZI|nr:hypothetical protein B0T18DRAFT_83662 [Schizothecium vesticola]